MHTKSLSAAVGALTLLAGLALAAPAQASGNHHDHDTAKLSVLHGVPGLIVDVWVDGKLTLDNFTPEAWLVRWTSALETTRSPSRARMPRVPTTRDRTR